MSGLLSFVLFHIVCIAAIVQIHDEVCEFVIICFSNFSFNFACKFVHSIELESSCVLPLFPCSFPGFD